MLEAAGDCFSMAECWSHAADVYSKANSFFKCLSTCSKSGLRDEGLQFIKQWKENPNMDETKSQELNKHEQLFLDSCSKRSSNINSNLSDLTDIHLSILVEHTNSITGLPNEGQQFLKQSKEDEEKNRELHKREKSCLDSCSKPSSSIPAEHTNFTKGSIDSSATKKVSESRNSALHFGIQWLEKRQYKGYLHQEMKSMLDESKLLSSIKGASNYSEFYEKWKEWVPWLDSLISALSYEDVDAANVLLWSIVHKSETEDNEEETTSETADQGEGEAPNIEEDTGENTGDTAGANNEKVTQKETQKKNKRKGKGRRMKR